MIILDLWSQQPGKFFCISTKSGAGTWKDHFFTVEDFGKIKSFLREHEDDNIYFCPHGFNRRVRQKGEAVLPNMLWADLDFVDPKEIKPKPTIAIESSPGRYVGLWILKETMTEELNRRLTYHLKADKGGWDVTQVLRFPGTKNYKYKSAPRVRKMWDDGPIYSTKKISSYLPPIDVVDAKDVKSAAEVYEKYEEQLPRWARRELMRRDHVGINDRSEMLWKLENACVEAGMSMEEAFAVIKRSVWNKFAGRRSEDEQLEREIRKVIENQFREKPKGADKRHMKSDEEISEEDKPKKRFSFVPMRDVEAEELDFIWWPYLAKGEVSILEGDPGLGKSYLAQIVAASVATGTKVPCFRKGTSKVKGRVVYFDIENSRGSVTKPRLENNGFIKMKHYYQVEEPFSIDDSEALDEIYEHLEEIKPTLVVFDTLNTYIGRADTHKASEVTQAFGIFKAIARDFGCSVLIIRHLTKGSGSAMYRGQGSIAFSGSARVVMSVGVDPNDTDTRVMAITKINFAKAPKALSYRIEERKGGKAEFVWGDFVDLTSQEIMDASTEARQKGKIGDAMQDAMEFLENNITGMAIEVGKLYRMAEKRGIDRDMLERASKRIGVEITQTGKKASKVVKWTILKEEAA